MVREDPYTPERGYYECWSCGCRTASEERVEQCPECGGDMHNIAVPRE